MKDREIEGLKARLYPRNEQDMITSTKWGKSEVRLTSPSAEQCTDVLTRIEKDHQQVYLSDSSSDVAQLLVVPLLQKKNIRSLYILSTSLTRDFIDLFASQMLDDNTLESLYLNHNSIDDDGVIILVQSLKYNKKLQYLSLDFNTGITSLSVPSLAEFIRINSTLSVLYVSHTRIDTRGVLELVDSLKSNTRLGKIVVDEKHKAMCTKTVGKINRLDFSYTTATAYEYTGVNLGGLLV
ncbi:PREDICTED: nucleotide-binding oligomerization domain-containing protein 1-like [Amphimedon queenslandica]|nr:PREDICTED: nucleotide-binding oligomerization domain-containing protein 1-like [Amphimedon queenslandica]|eukprot:XP_019857916.1 PREDICTED: nucleotide-binding oligomerization domain-containing protein 1-like [Amphimedon queenslandica]